MTAFLVVALAAVRAALAHAERTDDQLTYEHLSRAHRALSVAARLDTVRDAQDRQNATERAQKRPAGH